jgi:hypothetical protein
MTSAIIRLWATLVFAEFEFPRRHQVYHKEKPFQIAQSTGKRDQNSQGNNINNNFICPQLCEESG